MFHHLPILRFAFLRLTVSVFYRINFRCVAYYVHSRSVTNLRRVVDYDLLLSILANSTFLTTVSLSRGDV